MSSDAEAPPVDPTAERNRHSAAISRYQKVIAALDPIEDKDMIASYMTRIAERKKEIIGLKPLAQRKETLNKLIETNMTRA
eukprot:8053430-Karenia_brevis.AAC.1